MTTRLYAAIVEAEKAARYAYDLSHTEGAGFWTRSGIGRAQSILMHYVVKYAVASMRTESGS